MATFGPVQRKAYGEQVCEHLRESIVSGQLAVGHRLVEKQLADQFDVSRGPIRDALSQLERESLVASHGTGTYVIGIADTDIDELYSLRGAIETLAVDLAIERSNDNDWQEMAALAAELEKAADDGDRKAFAAADIRFHSLIYTFSRHRRLTEIWQQYAPMLTTLLRRTVLVDADLHASAAKHRLLLELMMVGDHAVVAAELREHLENSHRSMIAAHRTIAQVSNA